MARMPELSPERVSVSSRIGSIEHIESSAQLADKSQIQSVGQLREFLQTNYFPESLAYFIFDYQTRETRRFWTPEKTAVINTKGLTANEPSWPIFEAEYHYDPQMDNNYISVYGRPHPLEEPEFNNVYHMRISLTNSLEITDHSYLDAYQYFGDSRNPLALEVFRTAADSADPRYQEELNPKTFIDVLQATAVGLKQYLYLRDYL